jgi:hypothetical protein
MLFKTRILDGLVRGTVSLAFRRWPRPRVRAGTRLRTAAGLVEIRTVDPVPEETITTVQARRAGYASREDLLRELRIWGRGPVFRIAVRFAGPDPRIALRARRMTAPDREMLEKRLNRWTWSGALLRAIRERPGVRAADLAAAVGMRTTDLKRRVRQLKELGLTISLGTGYRLSPRGRSILGS